MTAASKIRIFTRWSTVTLMGAAVMTATADGFVQSYAGLYHWALEHGLTGWKAQSFPLMVDLFIVVGELGLFLLAIDAYRVRRKQMLSWLDFLLPGLIAAAGWTASLIFNIGHVQSQEFSYQATAAVPPIVSMLGLLVLLRTLHRYVAQQEEADQERQEIRARVASSITASSNTANCEWFDDAVAGSPSGGQAPSTANTPGTSSNTQQKSSDAVDGCSMTCTFSLPLTRRAVSVAKSASASALTVGMQSSSMSTVAVMSCASATPLATRWSTSRTRWVASLEKDRAVPPTSAVSGTTFWLEPARSVPTVATTGSNMLNERVIAVCSRGTNSAAAGIGSSKVCGAEPCPPRPWKTTVNRSEADSIGPRRSPNTPCGSS